MSAKASRAARVVLVDEREGLARRVQEIRRELLDLLAEGLGVRLAHRAPLLELLLEGLGDGVLPFVGINLIIPILV